MIRIESGDVGMSNIKKLSSVKTRKKKSSVVPLFAKSRECGVVINMEAQINKAIEARLGRFVKEIQAVKAKQKKIEARQKAKHQKCTIESIQKTKKPKLKTKKNNSKLKTKKPKK
jgi:hypothetical protein